ncbi:MAG: hypothetical protein ACYC7A_21895 [Thermoanaerobaculia bacterium]
MTLRISVPRLTISVATLIILSCTSTGLAQKWDTARTEIGEACSTAEPEARRFCRRIAETRAAYILSVSRRFEPDAKRLRRFITDTKQIVELAKRARAEARWICKVRQNGSVQCIELARLLGRVQAQTAKRVLDDLAIVRKAIPAAKPSNVLFQCPSGNWSSSSDTLTDRIISSSDSAAGAASSIGKMLARCSLIDQVAAHPKLAELLAQNGAGSPGAMFSPRVSGFDFMPSFCGFDIESGVRGASYFVESLERAIDSYLAKCGTPEPPDSSIMPPDTLMDGQGEVQDGPADDATVTSSATTTSTSPSGSTVVTTTDTYSDGTVVTASTDTGTGQTTTSAHFSDGSSRVYDVGSDGKVDAVHTTDSSGYQQSTYFKADGATPTMWKDNEGRFVEFDDKGQPKAFRDTDGKWYRRTPNGFAPVKPRPQPGPGGGTIQCENADGSACQPCSLAGELLEQRIDDCMTSGGRSAACKSYLSASECCASSPFADPTIIMPVPEGGVACVSGDLDVQKKRCDRICSVAATDVNCKAECMKERPSIEFDLFDHICLYAYSEDCPRSQATIVVPRTPGGGVQPLPLPTARMLSEIIWTDCSINAAACR